MYTSVVMRVRHHAAQPWNQTTDTVGHGSKPGSGVSKANANVCIIFFYFDPHHKNYNLQLC